MTSQVRYNTQLSKSLLQALILILDNHQITSDDFIDTTDENDARFVEAMPEFKKMLQKLDLDISFLKSSIDEEDAKNKRKIYFFNVGDNPINYKIDDLNEEELIKYSLVIVYLMLKNGQYVSSITLSRIFPRFDRKTMALLKESLLDCIAEDIEKNKYQSLILVDYE